VAAHFGITERTLHTEFLRKERTRIGAFISEVRIEAVKNILLTTDKRCFEIAHEFTFGREDVLSRWFKQRTGMTTREFRLENGKQEPSGGGQNLSENNAMCKIANQNSKVNLQREFCCIANAPMLYSCGANKSRKQPLSILGGVTMKRVLYSLAFVLVLALEIVIFTQQAKAACASATCEGGGAVTCCGYTCSAHVGWCRCIGPDGNLQSAGSCKAS
jgi:AraC-like DNA-binding protein